MPLRFDILRTVEEWKAFNSEWLDLRRRSEYAKPFQHPEWLLPWWRQFGQQDLRGVVFRQNESLLGMLPAYVYPDPQSGQKQLPFAGAGTSDYLDGVFSRDCPP